MTNSHICGVCGQPTNLYRTPPIQCPHCHKWVCEECQIWEQPCCDQFEGSYQQYRQQTRKPTMTNTTITDLTKPACVTEIFRNGDWKDAQASIPVRKTKPSEDVSGITTDLMTITPDIAREMLGHNENNRNIGAKRVELLATEMRRGAWRVNGDSIRFSNTGRLLDGQHRLLACIKADTPFQTFVVRGLPDKTQETMDTGKPRTMGNIMQIRGESDTARLSSVLRAVYVTSILGLEAGAANNIAPSRSEQLEFFDNTPQVKELAKAGTSFYHASNKLLSPALYAALYWTFSRIDENDADEFFDLLESGAGLEKNSPILVLRNYLIAVLQARNSSSAYQRRRTAAVAVKAWNKWRDGVPVTMLRFGANEEFPHAH